MLCTLLIKVNLRLPPRGCYARHWVSEGCHGFLRAHWRALLFCCFALRFLVHSVWFPWRQLHASWTSVVLCWVVRALCFLVGRNCGSRVVELAATPISTTQGAFVRLCIVRCPLPMIISSPSSLRAGGFLLFIGYELLEARPCHDILLFVFLSSFDCYRFIIMAHSLSS